MKKYILYLISGIIIASYFFIPDVIINASKKGIMLWFNTVLPTLFPCIIISNILIRSNLLNNKNRLTEIITIISGIGLGFPIGAKLTADFYRDNLLEKKDAQFLLSHSNHFSFGFISGYAVISLPQSKKYAIYAYIILYFPYIVSIIFHLLTKKTPQKMTQKTTPKFSLNMQNIDAAIIYGFESLEKICGYIVFFSIISSIVNELCNKGSQLLILLICALEATSGINMISSSDINIVIKYCITIFTLSFGGLSCLFQTKSIIADTDLSTKKYIVTKVIYGIISVMLVQLLFFLS